MSAVRRCRFVMISRGMPITCPNCQAVQADGAHFCSNCAAPLVANAAPPTAPVPGPAPAYSAPIPPPPVAAYNQTPPSRPYYQPAPQPPPPAPFAATPVGTGAAASRPFPLKPVVALVAAAALLFAGCNIVDGIRGATGIGGGSVALEGGFAKGHISDSDGRPITDATVYVTNQDYGGGPSVNTDSSGNYSAKAPAGNYRVSASVQRKYHDKIFHLGLEPQGRNTNFRIENGYVMNFVLKMNGAIPDSPNPDNSILGYWGAPFEISWEDTSHTDRVARQIPAGARIEVTFTPKGTLVDGRASQARTYSPKFKSSGSGSYVSYQIDPIVDVPAGAYTVTAKLTGAASTVLKVNLHTSFGQPMPTSDTFEPNPNSIGISPYTATCCDRVTMYLWPAG